MTTFSSVTLYHNPRCSKSRETLALLTSRGLTPDIIYYLDTPPSQNEIIQLLRLLNFSSARELMRPKENEYQTLQLSDPARTEHELLQALETYPQLMERPIVVYNNTARIGRPPKNVLAILPIC